MSTVSSASKALSFRFSGVRSCGAISPAPSAQAAHARAAQGRRQFKTLAFREHKGWSSAARADSGARRRQMMCSAESSKRALISVSDKTGITDLAKALSDRGYEILSTGGTAKSLVDANIAVVPVQDVTQFPEMLGGRVKTLHPAVHGGILARRDNSQDVDEMKNAGLAYIDVVVVNLYPFTSTVTSDPPPEFETGVENIDIGGPAMLRAAAKNHAHVAVVVDPADYGSLLENLDNGGPEFRKLCAWKAFQHTSTYDAQVAEWMWRSTSSAPPPEMCVPMRQQQKLRYGENPHQAAAFYSDLSLAESNKGGVASATQHHGKEMSYNNYLDTDAAFSAVCDFSEPSCVVVKHTNPCGVATREDLCEAYELAVKADPISAFGGIVAFNRPVTLELAQRIREFRSPTDGETRMFYEIVIAPEYTTEGLECLKGKSKTLRILEAKARKPEGTGLRQVTGGWLWQEQDTLTPDALQFECVSEAQPTEQMLADLKFSWLCVKHVKSNAITVGKDKRLLGMGSGQPNRVQSTQIALEKAGDEVKGSVLASDAFFPFSWGDSVEMACQAGVVAIAHPGGSMRDKDAVDCCNKYGVVLMTTNHRHFKH